MSDRGAKTIPERLATVREAGQSGYAGPGRERAPTPRLSSEGPEVAILGAGPAGLAAALALARTANSRVRVIERRGEVGGNAGSFELEGIWCDYGSHRLHPAAEAPVLDEIRAALGSDLLWRPRHGRIRLQNRWIHFPLKPGDLLLRLPPRFTGMMVLDMLRKVFPRKTGSESFATVLERGLGKTLSECFYFPYVRKLWGLDPADLAVTLARRRVSGSSISRIVRKVMGQVPGVRSKTAGGFYYPVRGFGQISVGLRDAAAASGAEFALGSRVTEIGCEGDRVAYVEYERSGKVNRERVDVVWSTLPVSAMVRMIRPKPPVAVLDAADRIRFRGMILIYLVLSADRFSEYDAHYFPELSIPISRMSEPKNYSGSVEPGGRTVLCAELPSDPDEATWEMSDDELGKQLCGWLDEVGLPVKVPVLRVETRRLRFAYPVYDRHYEASFRTMDEWLSKIDGLLTFGRQGLFAHDNTHHAMTMAFAAVDCLGPTGELDQRRWAGYRREFESHVVED